MKVSIKLLRPLDGYVEGRTYEFDKADADRLVSYGAAEPVAQVKQENAPANKAAPAPANKARKAAK